ncbi:response regulator [Aliishimia ponticola]|uniref:Sensory/regulatory protein RpfC n=1 Tax=Aliishimia ponticola TaxID=2499833 RepID=A0A4V6S1Z6_9RHOB|nr:ATP-binding protein [Aliishimia ponticola]THH34253.1 response regulator [Aliishimia ponticola]
MALSLCGVLLVMLASHRNHLQDNEQQIVFSISATTYKFSELIYEAQKLMTAFAFHRAGQNTREDLHEQFDVLWSRIGVVAAIDFKDRPMITKVLEDYHEWLTSSDAILYGGSGPLEPAELELLASSLDPLVVATRQAWMFEFNHSRFESLAEITRPAKIQRQRGEIMIAGLLSAIVLYLVAEVYFAALAQRRAVQLQEAAQTANRAKSDFIATVSHEIRTPLNGILGMASHLADQNLSEENRESVRIIQDSGGLLLTTINDVLDLAKIEAGEFALEFGDHDIRAALRTARELYLETARDKGLELDLTVSSSVPECLRVDERRCRQVIHNLVSNAVKFTQSGYVHISADYKKGTDAAHGILTISVEDSGPGIAKAAQARVFEPFGQADTGISRRFGGSGLGLSISRDICGLMGGSLELTSALGRGARFDMILPLEEVAQNKATSKRAQSDPQDATDLSGRKVLIVDDNRTNRLIVKKFIAPLGAEIAEAESGEDALRHLSQHPADIVLMDIQMPGMDGVQTTRKFLADRAQAGRVAPPIIGVTANAMPHQIEQYLASGMKEVLAKPVSKAALLRMLTRHLSEPYDKGGPAEAA